VPGFPCSALGGIFDIESKPVYLKTGARLGRDLLGYGPPVTMAGKSEGGIGAYLEKKSAGPERIFSW